MPTKTRGAKLDPIIITGIIVIGLLLMVVGLLISNESVAPQLKTQAVGGLSCPDKTNTYDNESIVGTGIHSSALTAKQLAWADVQKKIPTSCSTAQEYANQDAAMKCDSNCESEGDISLSALPLSAADCEFSNKYDRNRRLNTATYTCMHKCKAKQECQAPSPTPKLPGIEKCTPDDKCAKSASLTNYHVQGSGVGGVMPTLIAAKRSARDAAFASTNCSGAADYMQSQECAESGCTTISGTPSCVKQPITDPDKACVTKGGAVPGGFQYTASCDVYCDCTWPCAYEVTPTLDSPVPSDTGSIPTIAPEEESTTSDDYVYVHSWLSSMWGGSSEVSSASAEYVPVHNWLYSMWRGQPDDDSATFAPGDTVSSDTVQLPTLPSSEESDNVAPNSLRAQDADNNTGVTADSEESGTSGELDIKVDFVPNHNWLYSAYGQYLQ